MPILYSILHEIDQSPLTFHMIHSGSQDKHWHSGYELLILLEGQLKITIGHTTYDLLENQMMLINPYEVHTTYSENCVVGLLELLPDKLDPLIRNMLPQFNCNSATGENEEGYSEILRLIAKFIQAANKQIPHADLYFKSLAYALLHCLSTHFGIMEKGELPDKKQFDRMSEILSYINTHYIEGITLQKLSGYFYLTAPYIAKLFKASLGCTFLEYLNDIRLKYALHDLMHTSDSIEKLALNHGFPNTRSFTDAFQKEYQMLPSKYRKTKNAARNYHLPQPNNSFYAEHHHYLDLFTKYLDAPEPIFRKIPSSKLHIQSIPSVSVRQKGFLLHHTFKTTASIAKAKQILSAENQEMLRLLQKKIGFTYLYSHGLLDDDMMIYSEDAKGNPKFSFSYLDMAFDFLFSIRLKPFMNLTYMPKLLAKTPERKQYHTESIISLPNDMEKWTLLIRTMINHLISRYSYEEVTSWPFSLWNLPDSPLHMFGFEHTDEFMYFYQRTYHTIKEILPDCRFGTPSLLPHTVSSGNWLYNFLEYCKIHNCMPDYLNFHFYTSAIGVDTREIMSAEHLQYYKNPDALKDHIYRLVNHLKQDSIKFEYLYMNEWNSTLSHRDLLNDTAYKASFLAKNILENYDRLDSFCYWSLSDSNEEMFLSHNLFHGGLGMFTYNGICKSPFFALSLLARLGDHLIGRGDGYFITKKGNTYQIILYYYQHYSPLYADGELFDMTLTNRYTPFPEEQSKRVTLALCDLSENKYLLTHTILNREHGSSYDKWIELGALPLQTQDETDYLKSISIPCIKKQAVQTESNTLTITCTLKPHEVRFIEVNAEYG